MTGCCGYVCGPLCASVYLDVGVVVALLSSLESVLIKKEWFYCLPEVKLLHCKHPPKQSSLRGEQGVVGSFECSYLCKQFGTSQR